jgi:hypothetical protein
MWLVAVVGRSLVGCEHREVLSTCFGHLYAHLQENKGPVTAFGVLFWFCWMLLVAVAGGGLRGCGWLRWWGAALLDVVGSGCGALPCRMWLVAVVGRCLVGCGW